MSEPHELFAHWKQEARASFEALLTSLDFMQMNSSGFTELALRLAITNVEQGKVWFDVAAE